jgi:glycosyltransferase involved in cell wall biosynthesis
VQFHRLMEMVQRTKLLLLIPHLGGGGAERVISLLALLLDRRRFAIHLCLIAADAPGAQAPPEWVIVHRLHRKRVRHAWLQLIRLIRNVNPDVVLSGMAHLNFLVLALRPLLPSNIRILVRQNTTASAAATTWLQGLPYRYLYPSADAILCQSEAMAIDLADNFGIASLKLRVLANPVDTKARYSASSGVKLWPADSWPRLLTIGRLAEEKGIDLLLYALAQVQRRYPRLHAIVLGIGPKEAELSQLAAELSLKDCVSFPGFQENLADYYQDATLFVLPSRYEGMPNALLEAATAGLPIVATPCSAGLSALLQNSMEIWSGTWLASSITAESLASGILLALSNLSRPPALSQRFEHGFLAPFESGVAIEAYAALIERIATEARS